MGYEPSYHALKYRKRTCDFRLLIFFYATLVFFILVTFLTNQLPLLDDLIFNKRD